MSGVSTTSILRECVICIQNIPEREKPKIRRQILVHGGIVTETDTDPTCTHILLHPNQSHQYTEDLTAPFQPILTNIQWINLSIQAKKRLPVNPTLRIKRKPGTININSGISKTQISTTTFKNNLNQIETLNNNNNTPPFQQPLLAAPPNLHSYSNINTPTAMNHQRWEAYVQQQTQLKLTRSASLSTRLREIASSNLKPNLSSPLPESPRSLHHTPNSQQPPSTTSGLPPGLKLNTLESPGGVRKNTSSSYGPLSNKLLAVISFSDRRREAIWRTLITPIGADMVWGEEILHRKDEIYAFVCHYAEGYATARHYLGAYYADRFVSPFWLFWVRRDQFAYSPDLYPAFRCSPKFFPSQYARGDHRDPKLKADAMKDPASHAANVLSLCNIRVFYFAVLLDSKIRINVTNANREAAKQAYLKMQHPEVVEDVDFCIEQRLGDALRIAGPYFDDVERLRGIVMNGVDCEEVRRAITTVVAVEDLFNNFSDSLPLTPFYYRGRSSKIAIAQRSLARSLAQLLGLQNEKDISKSTHVIVGHLIDGRDFKSAGRFKVIADILMNRPDIHVVSINWLFQCYKEGRRASEDRFRITLDAGKTKLIMADEEAIQMADLEKSATCLVDKARFVLSPLCSSDVFETLESFGGVRFSFGSSGLKMNQVNRLVVSTRKILLGSSSKHQHQEKSFGLESVLNDVDREPIPLDVLVAWFSERLVPNLIVKVAKYRSGSTRGSSISSNEGSGLLKRRNSSSHDLHPGGLCGVVEGVAVDLYGQQEESSGSQVGGVPVLLVLGDEEECYGLFNVVEEAVLRLIAEISTETQHKATQQVDGGSSSMNVKSISSLGRILALFKRRRLVDVVGMGLGEVLVQLVYRELNEQVMSKMNELVKICVQRDRGAVVSEVRWEIRELMVDVLLLLVESCVWESSD